MGLNFVLAFAVSIGAILFAFPVVLFLRVFNLDKGNAKRWVWILLLSMCALFYVGYVLEAAHLFSALDVTRDDIFGGIILFGGSVFVLISSRVFYALIKNLEKAVEERAAELEKEHKRALRIEKDSKRALEASERKFRQLYENSNDAIMILNDKEFLDCNEATLKIFGCDTFDQFLGKHPGEVSPPEQPDGTPSINLANQRIATAFEKGKNFFEWVHRRCDGTDFPAEVLLTPFELNDEMVLQATVRDISHRKELDRLKDHFVFVAAHELRTPVTSLRWNLDLIKESKTICESEGETHEIVDSMTGSVHRLNELVNDLLDTSRLDYGTIKLKPKTFQVSQLVQRIAKELSPIIDKNHVKLSLDVEPIKELKIEADQRRVGEVLTNFISNAAKYSLPGGQITVTVEDGGQEVVFRVKDQGVGLSQEDIDLLFKKFSRPDNHPDDKDIESTGLGLYIVKTLVGLWDGRVWAESEGRGKGSTFAFTVPKQ